MPRKKRTASIQPRDVIHEEVQSRYKSVTSLNEEQKNYIKAINQNDIVIATGPAGTGKSYCAAGIAADYLNRGLVDRVIVSRSSVQADDIGFLPGTQFEKMESYIAQVLVDMGEFLNVKKELNDGRIEVLSLAFVRGRSFRNSFIILEEFQNCNYSQLKMFVTRIGIDSKMIINGDINQSDLTGKQANDCIKFVNNMNKIAVPENKIAIVELVQSVRHPVIDTILGVL